MGMENIPDKDRPPWKFKSDIGGKLVSICDMVGVEYLDNVSSDLDGRTSMICNFCGYLSPELLLPRDINGHYPNFCNKRTVPLPPEDIAIRAAEAVAIFQAQLEGTTWRRRLSAGAPRFDW